MDYYVLALIFIYIGGGVIYKASTNIYDSLERNQSMNVRAILVISVILYHISQKTIDQSISGEIYYHVFKSAGVYAVACFFAMSGYGLFYQLEHKGRQYLDGFISKRLITVIFPVLAALAIYLLLERVFGKSLDWENIIWMTVHGETVLPYSWFMMTIIFLYAIFYIAAKNFFVPKDGVKSLFLPISLGIFAYCGIVYFLSWGAWWTDSVWSFLLGGFLYVYRKVIEDFFENNRFALIGIFLLFIAAFIFHHKLKSYWIFEVIFSNIYTGLFVVIMLYFFSRWRGDNRVLRFIGKRSYEYYIVQGISMMITNQFFKLNNIGYVAFVLFGVIFLGEMLWILNGIFKRKWNR